MRCVSYKRWKEMDDVEPQSEGGVEIPLWRHRHFSHVACGTYQVGCMCWSRVYCTRYMHRHSLMLSAFGACGYWKSNKLCIPTTHFTATDIWYKPASTRIYQISDLYSHSPIFINCANTPFRLTSAS